MQTNRNETASSFVIKQCIDVSEIGQLKDEKAILKNMVNN